MAKKELLSIPGKELDRELLHVTHAEHKLCFPKIDQWFFFFKSYLRFSFKLNEINL